MSWFLEMCHRIFLPLNMNKAKAKTHGQSENLHSGEHWQIAGLGLWGLKLSFHCSRAFPALMWELANTWIPWDLIPQCVSVGSSMKQVSACHVDELLVLGGLYSAGMIHPKVCLRQPSGSCAGSCIFRGWFSWVHRAFCKPWSARKKFMGLKG